MAHTVNSVVVNAPYEEVFDISNKIEGWTELFSCVYAKADVLDRRGNEITFRITNKERGSIWVSKRWLYKDLKFVYGQRWDPVYPFKYFKVVWLYTEIPEGTKVTWIVDFELDPNYEEFTTNQIVGFINKHAQPNMQTFKKAIEAGRVMK
jgi:aromatase